MTIRFKELPYEMRLERLVVCLLEIERFGRDLIETFKIHTGK